MVSSYSCYRIAHLLKLRRGRVASTLRALLDPTVTPLLRNTAHPIAGVLCTFVLRMVLTLLACACDSKNDWSSVTVAVAFFHMFCVVHAHTQLLLHSPLSDSPSLISLPPSPPQLSDVLAVLLWLFSAVGQSENHFSLPNERSITCPPHAFRVIVFINRSKVLLRVRKSEATLNNYHYKSSSKN